MGYTSNQPSCTTGEGKKKVPHVSATPPLCRFSSGTGGRPSHEPAGPAGSTTCSRLWQLGWPSEAKTWVSPLRLITPLVLALQVLLKSLGWAPWALEWQWSSANTWEPVAVSPIHVLFLSFWCTVSQLFVPNFHCKWACCNHRLWSRQLTSHFVCMMPGVRPTWRELSASLWAPAPFQPFPSP